MVDYKALIVFLLNDVVLKLIDIVDGKKLPKPTLSFAN
jgi:hypothetical protein